MTGREAAERAAILRRGVALARGDNEILLMFAATTLINAASMVNWLFPKQLIDRGFPGDPVLWYTALGILSFVLAAAALRLVEARIDGPGVAKRAYVLACLTGVAGLIVLTCAPDALVDRHPGVCPRRGPTVAPPESARATIRAIGD